MDVLQGWWDWERFLEPLLKLVGALLLTLPVAWERERSTRIMGLRTFSLIAVASCGYVLIASRVVGLDAEPQARIIQGLMTGIGFVGGGAILKEGASVHGTATAVSIWMTGALGAAVAYSELEIAVLMSALNYLILRVLTLGGRHGSEE
ncbi:MAG TPA: MgtC/SapB family protein [Thermoanaerobaculia bacterium]|nr:MgtC/SapB family protein [Thermoanaerobaculia bacterium]